MIGEKLHCLNCDHTWDQKGVDPPSCCPQCRDYNYDLTFVERMERGQDKRVKGIVRTDRGEI